MTTTLIPVSTGQVGEGGVAVCVCVCVGGGGGGAALLRRATSS